MIIFGFMFYDHLPDFITIIGAIVIVISGIFIANQKLILEKK